MTSDFVGRPYANLGRLRPGSRIAGYLVEEQIGAGGMAVVFRAHDEALGRLAALKIIAPSMADDQEFRTRFLQESRAAAAVDSPYIVPVYAAGEDQGLLYIAMRFVRAGDLAALARRGGGRLEAGRAASLVSQVASALDAAHAAGLVHRDVKPANILVEDLPGSPESAYLSDFGLSKRMSSTGLTASGQFIGTPDYSAPEQIEGAHVDERTDQYALACVAFTLLTGTPPFRRADTPATLFAHLKDPVPQVTRQRPELPAAVDGVIARALAKMPSDRYERCGEFAAALRESLAVTEGNGKAARSGGAPGQGRGRGRRKARAIWAAGTAAVLAAGIVTAVVALSPKPGVQGYARPMWSAQGEVAPGVQGSGWTDAPGQEIRFASLGYSARADYLFIRPDGSVLGWRNDGPAPGGGYNWTSLGAVAPDIKGAGYAGPQDGQVQFVDLNGDGKADCVWVHTDGSLSAWVNEGIGSNGEPVWSGPVKVNAPVGYDGYGSIQFADLGGDGYPDYLLVHPDGSVSWWKCGGDLLAGHIWTAKGTIPSIGIPGSEIHFGYAFGGRQEDMLDVKPDSSATAWVLNAAASTWTSEGQVMPGIQASGYNASNHGDIDLADLSGAAGRDDYVWVRPDSSVLMWQNIAGASLDSQIHFASLDPRAGRAPATSTSRRLTARSPDR